MGQLFSVQSKQAEGGLGMVNYQEQLMEIMGGSNRVELRLAAKNVPKKDKLRCGGSGGTSEPRSRRGVPEPPAARLQHSHGPMQRLEHGGRPEGAADEQRRRRRHSRQRPARPAGNAARCLRLNPRGRPRPRCARCCPLLSPPACCIQNPP